MILNEYIDKLIKFRDEEKAGELEVIYAIDSEGNGFDTVYNSPTKCIFYDGEASFYDENKWDSEDDFKEEVNAVCIN